jgi:hypothetical protein
MPNLQRRDSGYTRMSDEAEAPETTSAAQDAAAPPAAFHVDGEPYLTATTAVELLTTDGLSYFGAYTRLRNATRGGHVRTVPLGGRRKMYHRGDVHALADRLRNA